VKGRDYLGNLGAHGSMMIKAIFKEISYGCRLNSSGRSPRSIGEHHNRAYSYCEHVMNLWVS
jgi:hypothetical protein